MVSRFMNLSPCYLGNVLSFSPSLLIFALCRLQQPRGLRFGQVMDPFVCTLHPKDTASIVFAGAGARLV